MTTPSGTSSDAWLRSSTRKPAFAEQGRRLRLGHAYHVGNRDQIDHRGGASADARRNTRNTSRASSVSSPKAVRMKGIWDGPRSGRVGIVWVFGGGAVGWVITRVVAAASIAPAGRAAGTAAVGKFGAWPARMRVRSALNSSALW